jgi:hypothetical protein
MLLPFLSMGAPIAFVVVLLLRKSGSNSRSGGGRHSVGSQPDSHLATADPGFAVQPDPGFAYQPDARFGGADSAVAGTAVAGTAVAGTGFGNATVGTTAFPPVGVAATSVLAGAPSGPGSTDTASSTSGDPFPTTGRALGIVGGHALTGLGLLVLLLSAKPTGHHDAHIGNSSIGLLGFVVAFVGVSFSLPATARVQRDVMGGGWNSRISLRYISPQIAWYVLSPSGISAAARRLNIAPALVMLVVYGLMASDVLLVAAHYFGR